MPPRRPVDPARILPIALAAGLAWFSVEAIQLARFKYFTIDEFQHAHSAWLMAS